MDSIKTIYNLKIIESGDHLEIYKMNNYAIQTGHKRDKLQTPGDNKNNIDDKANKKDIFQQKQQEERRKKTLTAARNNIIRLVRANKDMQTFITLTFKDSVLQADKKEKSIYDKSKKLLHTLFVKLRRDYKKQNPGKEYKFIWVLEFGGRLGKGRLHYHLLTNNDFSNIKLSKTKERKTKEHKQFEEDFRSKYWTNGWVDIRNLGTTGEDNTNIALYISTYIVKSLQQQTTLKNTHIYGFSKKTLNKPKEEKLYINCSLEDLLQHYCNLNYEIKYSSSYQIGYEQWNGIRKGTVSYFDMELKEK